MKVLLKNIQSIVSAEYDFPEHGLVQISGPNSNGKSILFKALGAVTALKILDNDERRALITDGQVQGTISMEHNGKALVVFLHEDRNSCVVVLIRQDGERITRTFRDGGIPELLHEFGFRCYGKNQVCLQLYETFGPMPFVNTPITLNGEIVESITEDTVAKTFLNNFKEITHKDAKEKLKLFDQKIGDLQRLKDSIVIYNKVLYTAAYNNMKRIYEILKYLEPMDLDHIKIPSSRRPLDLEVMILDKIIILPKLKIVDAEAPRLSKLHIVKFAPIMDQLENLSSSIQYMSEIKKGTCPTCGKLFIN